MQHKVAILTSINSILIGKNITRKRKKFLHNRNFVKSL